MSNTLSHPDADLLHVVVVEPDGTATRQEWPHDQTLACLQQAVGGLFDVVRLSPDLDLWLNDEGLITGLPYNPVASLIAGSYGFTHQGYVGTVVFTGGAGTAGETLSLSPETATQLCSLARLLTEAAAAEDH